MRGYQALSTEAAIAVSYYHTISCQMSLGCSDHSRSWQVLDGLAYLWSRSEPDSHCTACTVAHQHRWRLLLAVQGCPHRGSVLRAPTSQVTVACQASLEKRSKHLCATTCQLHGYAWMKHVSSAQFFLPPRVLVYFYGLVFTKCNGQYLQHLHAGGAAGLHERGR